MPMIPGSVSIDPAGTATGTGYAKEVYDELESGTDFGALGPPGLVTAKKQLADIANACAALITHVQSNAVVSTTGSGAGPPFTSTGTGTIA